MLTLSPFYFLGTLLGLLGLWYASEHVVGASLVIAKQYRFNTLVIGALFMALVTGLPEFILSVASIFNDTAQLSVGDIMSSNFIDTVVVVGFTALFAGSIRIKKSEQKRFFLLLSLVAFVMFFLFFLGTIHPMVGAALMCSYVALTFLLWKLRSTTSDEDEAFEVEHAAEERYGDHAIAYGLVHFVLLALSTEVALYCGKHIADMYAVPQEFLGATVFAVATSLPEFVISIHAARRKAYGLVVGNALGAALQQGLFSLGFLAMLAPKPITLQPVATLQWYMAAGFILFAASLYIRKINRVVGGVMTGLGCAFVIHEGLRVLMG